ncbi:unnamed protein product [Closterium sp. NIES-53]
MRLQIQPLLLLLLALTFSHHLLRAECHSPTELPRELGVEQQGESATGGALRGRVLHNAEMPSLEAAVAAATEGKNSSALGLLLRRQLKAKKEDPVLSMLADAWHNMLIAQYWAKKTSCGSKLTLACKALQNAESYLKAGKGAQATAQMNNAKATASGCANSVPAQSAKYIRVAKDQIGQTQILMAKKNPQIKRVKKRNPQVKRNTGPGWLGHNDLPGGIMQWLPYGNPIDDCWMGGNWNSNIKKLADCVEGYASGTTGGKAGQIYHVTRADDNRMNPSPGTLRYGITRAEPLWIVFDDDFTFTGLSAEMIIYKDKTIDARGRKIVVGNGPCFAVEETSNVIIHGVSFVNCKNRVGNLKIVTGPDNTLDGRDYLNGYGVYIYMSHHVWIDHCSFNYADDTHIDIIEGSTAVTVSNSYFTNQDKVILMGHNDANTMDRNMRVTVMLNKFGPNLDERMPRGRFGTFHVVNNYYPNGWGIYAIGGSADPTFLSEGNYFVATGGKTEVTKHDIAASKSMWSGWDWQSVGDYFAGGAFFTESGSSGYRPPYSYQALKAIEVPRATNRAGPIGF